ncbi:MAG TPA: efflux RND transporter periplasmic adaptor subunit [Quisquiliibacterium sp.]|nr:efflux RND transporter periplasmic adaptor subunit [Quisquiliibacterium sp.]
MKRRSTLLLAIGALLIAALSAWAFTPRPIPVETRVVGLASFEASVDEEGRTRVRDRFTISAPAAGRLGRIELKAGDAVDAGDLLAVIRPAPPALQDSRMLAQLRERVGAAQAALLRAEAVAARAQAGLAQARADAKRAAELAQRGFASSSAAEQAALALAQQEQTLKAAQFEQRAAGHELAVAQAALAQTERPDRASAGAAIEIRAPVAGRVLEVTQESEAVVTAGEPLLDLGDPASLEAVVEVLSQDATRIRPGMAVRMQAAPGAPELGGRVRRVEPSARTKVSALGVEEQRVDVVIDLLQAPESIGDGYRVDARIVVLSEASVPVVPVGALFRQGDGWSAFVLDGGRAHRREVRIGARNQRAARVTDGLEPGETVIVYPPDTVGDGVRVRPRD